MKDNTLDKNQNPAKVEVVFNNEQYQLLVNDSPFFIKGAGLEFGNIKSLAESKGNAFRTWRTENGKKSAIEVLDEAHENGLMVAMGLDIARERHGFDYDDKEQVNNQLIKVQKEVEALKNHPALLMWVIGNELNLRYSNVNVWNAVNDISKMIHKVDPKHPTTTAIAGISPEVVAEIKEKCTDLDLLCFQIYGELTKLPLLLKKSDWNGPYIITEWGATGHWEVPKTIWGAPIEENTSVKAQNYLTRYREGILSDSKKCLGSFVFLWGQKQERTPTWYGLFLEDGSKTEVVDVMQYVWTNSWPENRAPKILSFMLNTKTAYESVILTSNSINTAIVDATDVENHDLTFVWEVLEESTKLGDGGDYEPKPKKIDIEILHNENGKIEFITPNKKGNYRLFVYIKDGNNNSATANIPFKVS